MIRDFAGYGAEPPHAGWPGNARIAVNFVINFEEGSELSYPAGDGVSEGGVDRDARERSRGQRARPRCREYVRIWRQGRLLATTPDLYALSAAGDDLWLRPGIRGESAGMKS